MSGQHREPDRFPSHPNAYEVIAHAVQSNPNIEFMTLVAYQEGPNWRERVTEESGDLSLLVQGLQQDQGERVLIRLPRNQTSAENLREIANSLGNDKLLGVISRVLIVGGGSAHIPMMDFMCAISRRNQEVLIHALRDLHQGPGWLLESGRSYHYYGLQLLTEEKWRVFLGKCLLMSGYTDDRYIGHQLVDGHCVLRLSSGRLKMAIPRVVAGVS